MAAFGTISVGGPSSDFDSRDPGRDSLRVPYIHAIISRLPPQPAQFRQQRLGAFLRLHVANCHVCAAPRQFPRNRARRCRLFHH